MKTQSALLVALLVAANVAFASDVNTASPATTNQRDLHNVQADYATVQRAHGIATPVVADASVGSVPDRPLNTSSPSTTNQADLHNVQADYASVARTHGDYVPVTSNVVFVTGSANPRFIDTASPSTTNQKDLHNVNADYATVAQAHATRAEKASRYAQN